MTQPRMPTDDSTWMAIDKPVFIIAFANTDPSERRFLRDLLAEQRELESVLRDGDQTAPWEVRVLPHATLKDVFEVFQDANYARRVVALHFAGHADNGDLVLNRHRGPDAAISSDGLAMLLKWQPCLRLVFLNACATFRTGDKLLAVGIPAVVSTSSAIRDEFAAQFAVRFYQGIVGGHSIFAAYECAVGGSIPAATDPGQAFALTVRDEASAFPGSKTEASDVKEHWGWPWKVFGQDTALAWKLEDDINDPLFGVPPLPPGIEPPARPSSPFRMMARFTEDDAPIFFGRSRAIRECWQKLAAPETGLLLIHGPVGAGKSSFLEAGLIPRLRRRPEGGIYQIIHLRRSRALGLESQLLESLGREVGVTNESVAALWIRLEQAGVPLLVVVDQAEESFTNPRGNPADEWHAFLRALAPLFGKSGRLPHGRLILSFRKEWLAEIEGFVRERLTDQFATYFLKPLDYDGLVEATCGVADVGPLREHYGLTVEAGVAERIANDLIRDRDSALAPTLQIILSDLWVEAGEQAKAARRSDRVITDVQYETLRNAGATLRHFLQRQIEQLAAISDSTATEFGITPPEWRRRIVDSGLALDLLTLHTTPRGTSNRVPGRKIEETYPQLAAPLRNFLLERLCALHLLTYPASTRDAEAVDTCLAHDALAPLVREKRDLSDAAGQRASRLLETHLRNLAGSASQPIGIEPKQLAESPDLAGWISDHQEEAALSAKDLGIVRAGREGRRAMAPAEQALFDASEQILLTKNSAQAAANRRFKVLVLAAFVFSIASAWWVYRSAREENLAKNKNVHQNSMRQYEAALQAIKDKNDDEALLELLYALEIWPDNRLAADRFYCLLTQHPYAIPIWGPFAGGTPGPAEEHASVVQLGITNDGDARVLSHGKVLDFTPGSGQRHQRKPGGELTLKIKGSDHTATSLARLSSDGRWLADRVQAAGGDQVVLFDLDSNSDEPSHSLPTSVSVKALAQIPDSHLLLAASDPQGDGSPGVFLAWDYSLSEPQPVSSPLWDAARLAAPGASTTVNTTGIFPFPDGKRVAITYNVTANYDATPGSPDSSWLPREVCDVVRLRSHTHKLGSKMPLIEGITGTPAFHDEAASIAFAMDGISNRDQLIVAEINRGDWKPRALSAGSQLGWFSYGLAQCWPGTDLHVLFGMDRYLLAEMIPAHDWEYSTTFGGLGILPGHVRIGRNGYILSWEELRESGQEVPDRYSLFDGRPGVVMPEIRPLNGQTDVPPPAAVNHNQRQLAVSRDNRISLNAVLEGKMTDDTQLYPLKFILRREGAQDVPLPQEFVAESMLDLFRAAFSKNGDYVVVAHDDGLQCKLMVWQTADGQSVTGMQFPSREFGHLAALVFGDEPETLCLVNDNGRVLLWDWRRASPFSDLLEGPTPKGSVRIDHLNWSSGKVAFDLVGANVRQRWVFEVGFAAGPPRDRGCLGELATILTGKHVDLSGNVRDNSNAQESRAQDVRIYWQKLQHTPFGDPSADLCRWYLDSRARRTVSPSAQQHVSDAFDDYLRTGNFARASLLIFGDQDRLSRLRLAEKLAREAATKGN